MGLLICPGMLLLETLVKETLFIQFSYLELTLLTLLAPLNVLLIWKMVFTLGTYRLSTDLRAAQVRVPLECVQLLLLGEN